MFKFNWMILPICLFYLMAYAQDEKSFSGQQNEKWSEVQDQVGKLKTKVDAQTSIVNDLLKSKKNNGGKISNSEIDELKKQHEKLKNLTKDYNEILSDFQFRFPEKGLTSGRKYIRIENQSIEQMENNTTFEGRLKKLHRKIKKQYQFDDPDDNAKKKPTHKPQKIPVGSKGLDTIKSNEKSTDPQVTDQIDLVK